MFRTFYFWAVKKKHRLGYRLLQIPSKMSPRAYRFECWNICIWIVLCIWETRMQDTVVLHISVWIDLSVHVCENVSVYSLRRVRWVASRIERCYSSAYPRPSKWLSLLPVGSVGRGPPVSSELVSHARTHAGSAFTVRRFSSNRLYKPFS